MRRLRVMTERIVVRGAGGLKIDYEQPEPRAVTLDALDEIASIGSVKALLRSRGYKTAAVVHEETGITAARLRALRRASR